MLHQDGVVALKESARLYGECCRSMAQTWGLGFSHIPSWEATNAFIERYDLRSMEAHRDFLTDVWARAKTRLLRQIDHRAHPSSLSAAPRELRAEGFHHRQYAVMSKVLHAQPGSGVLAEPWRALESSARRSLGRAVDAFNFLEDTELAEPAHVHAHKVAALAGGIFGCGIKYRQGTYWDTCPVSLMHSRLGMSVGFTSTRVCSLCGEDLDLCEHLLDVLYEVQVHRSSEGICNACGRLGCSHSDGEMALSYPRPVMGDAQIDEVSLVPRPRDPLARITEVEIDPQLLARSLGAEPSGRSIRCFRCLRPCGGFRSSHDKWGIDSADAAPGGGRT